MSDSELLSYIGAITGVIGAAVGTAGAVMGYVSYRRTEEIKSLDLRLELKKAENDLRNIAADLPAHLEYVKKSHKRVAAATQHLTSGAFQKWIADWESDFGSAQAMVSALPEPSSEYANLSHSALESKIVAVHAAFCDARTLREKYDAMLDVDDKEREHIREDLRGITRGKLRGKQ